MGTQPTITTVLALFLLLLPCLLNVSMAAEEAKSSATTNPFTPRASLIRYWNKEIRNDIPKSPFLLSKASPLNAVQSASFSKLASTNSLGTHLQEFCSSAKLFCFPDLRPFLEKHEGNSNFAVYSDKNFAVYSDKNFTNYGTKIGVGFNTFKNYSDAENAPLDNFRMYSRGSHFRKNNFANYAADSNVGDQSFNSYDAGATAGASKFRNYGPNINVAHLKFSSYTDDGNFRANTFLAYTPEANAGDQTFTSYGKHGIGDQNIFATYGHDSNVVGSNFVNYGKSATGATDTFKAYGDEIANDPSNNFKNYGDGGFASFETFTTYRNRSNVGDDSFQSYARNSSLSHVNFGNYGKSFNEGTDKFTGYAQLGDNTTTVGFTSYGVNNTFKEYADKKAVSFNQYSTPTGTATLDQLKEAAKKSGLSENKWVVEPGKFFREKMLQKGTVMPMPDIRDKMPKRSFLPRTITSKMPFSSSKIGDIKAIFHAADDSAMEKIIKDALGECERAPSARETKRCVGSAEDMIDFATSMLGRDIALRTTENTKGSKGNIMIGEITKINGGTVTKSVSCHQSLYPYLLYYCHSVPKVRVYEANLLDPNSKAKINHGVAICHIDTSAWGRTHGAFLSLGSEPGKIEVCHWIFENDMTWTIAD